MHVYLACGAVGVFLSLESSLFFFLTGNLAELVCRLKPHPLSSPSRARNDDDTGGGTRERDGDIVPLAYDSSRRRRNSDDGC